MTLDPIPTVRSYLLTQTALTALVDSRIYSPMIPEDATSFPAISYQLLAGDTHIDLPVSHPVLEFRCWQLPPPDSTFESVRQVFLLLHTALHAISNTPVTGLGRILWCRCVQESRDLQDPSTHWLYSQSMFQFGITNEP